MDNSKGITLSVLLVSMFFLITACADSAPSEELAKETLSYEARGCPGCFEIVKYKKTNGIKNGITYQEYFACMIEFKKDCYVFKDYSSPSQTFSELKHLIDKDSFRNPDHGVLINSGDRYVMSGIIYFVKTEKGWMPSKRSPELEKVFQYK